MDLEEGLSSLLRGVVMFFGSATNFLFCISQLVRASIALLKLSNITFAYLNKMMGVIIFFTKGDKLPVSRLLFPESLENYRELPTQCHHNDKYKRKIVFKVFQNEVTVDEKASISKWPNDKSILQLWIKPSWCKLCLSWTLVRKGVPQEDYSKSQMIVYNVYIVELVIYRIVCGSIMDIFLLHRNNFHKNFVEDDAFLLK